MKILLSPAKSINPDPLYPEIQTSLCSFLDQSNFLVTKLQKYSPKKLAGLFHVSSEIAELNFERFKNWKNPEKADETIKPCVFAFNGEVYRGLDASNRSKQELEYLNNHLRILSGLYGILKPGDLIYPYRLEMGTKIKLSSKISNLYQFWGDRITDYLNQEEGDVIVNLASTEYFKAINLKKIKARVVTPVFKEFKNGEYKMLMTYAKHARGEMAKFCALENIKSVEQIKLFNLLNYQYMENLSTENEWVFVR